MARTLRPLPVPGSSRELPALLDALAAALDGSGPALLPLPADPTAAARVLTSARPDEPLEDPDVAVVLPTTGSTGEPKNASLPAASLLAAARATSARLGGPGTWLAALPLDHIGGLQVLVRALAAGTTPHVLDLSAGFRPEAFAAATGRLPGTGRRYTSLVPTQLLRLLDAAGEAVDALASYDAVLVGGAATPPALLARARAAGVRAVPTYGMTETCGGCVYDGHPLDGVEVSVREDGRISLRGPVLFAGYHLRPDLTAAALRDGELLTADLGRIDEGGRLEVLGRIDDVVVTGGENVALLQVDAALAEHPALREAAAVGVPDPEWGQRVVAAVVPWADPPGIAELRAWVSERAGRAAAPRDVVVLAALPLVGPGKVDRRALREQVLSHTRRRPASTATAGSTARTTP